MNLRKIPQWTAALRNSFEIAVLAVAGALWRGAAASGVSMAVTVAGLFGISRLTLWKRG